MKNLSTNSTARIQIYNTEEATTDIVHYFPMSARTKKKKSHRASIRLKEIHKQSGVQQTKILANKVSSSAFIANFGTLSKSTSSLKNCTVGASSTIFKMRSLSSSEIPFVLPPLLLLAASSSRAAAFFCKTRPSNGPTRASGGTNRAIGSSKRDERAFIRGGDSRRRFLSPPSAAAGRFSDFTSRVGCENEFQR